jgi:Amt family ammonium transporter
MRGIIWPVVLAMIASAILVGISLRWAAEFGSLEARLSLTMAFLFPIGLALLAWVSLPLDRSESVAGLATLALALAVIGYFAIGFGLQYGGAAFISDKVELQGLDRFFSLMKGNESNYWGIFGLDGFLLSGDAATPAALELAVSELPLVTAAVLIVALGFPRRAPLLALLLSGMFVAAVTYPLAGYWTRGGGWLARLGRTMALGHGTIDFLGTATVFVVAGATVLAAGLAFDRPHASVHAKASESEPFVPAQVMVLAALGALLVAVGWLALGLVNPLQAELRDALNWPLIAANGLAGMAGGALVAQLYGWFFRGRVHGFLGARGALAGLIAVGAGAPFYGPWAALSIGAVGGLLVPLTTLVAVRLLDLDDVTAAIATYLVPGFWGMLSVGLFADGRSGSDWNGVEALPGQGVSGLIVAPGIRPDGGQLAAQLWGAIVLFVLGFLLPWGAFKLIAWLPSYRRSRRLGAIKVGHTQANHASTDRQVPSATRTSAPSPLDRAVNVDDGG